MESKSWLQEHLNDFVLPHLGYIPRAEDSAIFFTKEEMAVLKNLWRSVKRTSKGKLLVLPGKEMFVFEILARRESYSTLFLPECSKDTADLVKSKIHENSFVFSSGVINHDQVEAEMRAVHKVLTRMHRDHGPLGACDCYNVAIKGATLPYILESSKFAMLSDIINTKNNVFPTLTWGRKLAYKLFNMPSYWSNAVVINSEVVQPKSGNVEFEKAAIITQQIYKDSSPSFVWRSNPLGLPRMRDWRQK